MICIKTQSLLKSKSMECTRCSNQSLTYAIYCNFEHLSITNINNKFESMNLKSFIYSACPTVSSFMDVDISQSISCLSLKYMLKGRFDCCTYLDDHLVEHALR